MKLERFVTIVCGILLVCMLLMGLYFWQWYKAMNRINALQPMRIMVDGELYSHGGGVKQERPEGLPDGFITEVIEPVDYPEKDGQANFGSVGSPYWYYGSKIVVECDRYRIFD